MATVASIDLYRRAQRRELCSYRFAIASDYCQDVRNRHCHCESLSIDSRTDGLFPFAYDVLYAYDFWGYRFKDGVILRRDCPNFSEDEMFIYIARCWRSCGLGYYI